MLLPLFGWQNQWDWVGRQGAHRVAVCLGPSGWRSAGSATRKPLFFFLLSFRGSRPHVDLVVLIRQHHGERFVYLPSIGLAGCVVAAICALGPLVSRQRLRPYGLRSRIPVPGMCRANLRPELDWLDHLSLWPSAVRPLFREAPRPYNWARPVRNCPAGCRTPCRVSSSVAHRPRVPRGALRPRKPTFRLPGRLPDAIVEYRAALRINPAYAEAHSNLDSRWRIPAALAGGHGRVSSRAADSIPDLAEGARQPGLRAARIPAGVGRKPLAEYKRRCVSTPITPRRTNNLGLALANPAGRWPGGYAEYQPRCASIPNLAQCALQPGTRPFQLPGRLPDANCRV